MFSTVEQGDEIYILTRIPLLFGGEDRGRGKARVRGTSGILCSDPSKPSKHADGSHVLKSIGQGISALGESGRYTKPLGCPG